MDNQDNQSSDTIVYNIGYLIISSMDDKKQES